MSFNIKTTVLYFAVVFLFVIDRFLKFIALNGYSEELIPRWLEFDFVKNYYIAFSLPLYGFWLNLLIALILISLISYFVFLIKKPAYLEAGFLFPIILGASSNLFDRLSFGYVIDYLDLSYFTVFNLADVMIFLGIVGLLTRKAD